MWAFGAFKMANLTMSHHDTPSGKDLPLTVHPCTETRNLESRFTPARTQFSLVYRSLVSAGIQGISFGADDGLLDHMRSLKTSNAINMEYH